MTNPQPEIEMSRRCFVAVNKRTREINVYSTAGTAEQARDRCTQTSIPADEYRRGKKAAWQFAYRRGWHIRAANVVLHPQVTR